MSLAFTPITSETNLATAVSGLLSRGIQLVSGSVQYVGDTGGDDRPAQGSIFSDGAAIGLTSGVLLTTGSGAPAVTNSPGSPQFGVATGGLGDAQLQAIVTAAFPDGNVSTSDANILEFDIQKTNQSVTSVTFKFVFGSDEFPEFSSNYPDVAGIFVENTDGTNNYALFPNGKPLSVLNDNLRYFTDNQNGQIGIEYDGVSIVLSLTVALDGDLGSVHHIKLAIADTGDEAVDSGLFVQSIVGSDADGGPIVSGPPTGADDLATVAENRTSLTVAATTSGNVLANDIPAILSDVLGVVALDGNAASVGHAVQGTFGRLLLQADGSYTYSVLNTDKLIKGESGNDSFTYTVSDGHGGTDTAMLSFTVVGDNLDVFASGSFVAHRGDDQVKGGDGADNFAGRDGNDTLLGNGGNDKLFGDNGADMLSSGAGGDTLVGGDGADTLDGGAGADTLQGQAGDDKLLLGSGDDSAWGGVGDDTLQGDDGNDQIVGGDGKDTLSGNSGNDAMWGDAGDDKLTGGAGVDQLTGGSGSDKLFLDAGNDTAWGGDGNDQFIFANGFGKDRIKDFQPGDTIVFSGPFSSFLSVDAHMSHSGQNVVIDAGSGNTITVEHVAALHKGDFLFI